jgi:hypothetical protein
LEQAGEDSLELLVVVPPTLVGALAVSGAVTLLGTVTFSGAL